MSDEAQKNRAHHDDNYKTSARQICVEYDDTKHDTRESAGTEPA